VWLGRGIHFTESAPIPADSDSSLLHDETNLGDLETRQVLGDEGREWSRPRVKVSLFLVTFPHCAYSEISLMP